MNRTITLQINHEYDNLKIHSVLSRLGFSSAIIKSLKDYPDSVLLNSSSAKIIDRVFYGDVLSVTVSEPASDITPVNLPLDIIYEDEDIVAVNKPRNMPTHPSFEHTTDTLANALMYYYNANLTFHPITRIDKDTSGVVLVAKNMLSAHILTESIKTKQIQKQYIAVVNGTPFPLEGTISAPIEKSDGIRRTVSPIGKDAVSKYSTIKSIGNLSLVSLIPITGRTHQLRVHLAHLGTPIYGDWLYNTNPSDGILRLHCHAVTFNHPITKETISITTPCPDDMNILN